MHSIATLKVHDLAEAGVAHQHDMASKRRNIQDKSWFVGKMPRKTVEAQCSDFERILHFIMSSIAIHSLVYGTTKREYYDSLILGLTLSMWLAVFVVQNIACLSGALSLTVVLMYDAAALKTLLKQQEL
jgi:hypothetical protein